MTSSTKTCTSSNYSLESVFESVFESNIGPETFGPVFEDWLLEQKRDLEDLTTAAGDTTESTQYLGQLVDRVMGHYETYYRVKSESAKRNVLLMLNPTWLTNLESAFLWVGGWRPTMAFHLLYSTSGMQLEAGLAEFPSGLGKKGDMGGLSPSQLVRVNELQSQTIEGEKELSETLAAQQETVADSSMVELTRSESESESVMERVEFVLARKEHGLEVILGKADNLRLKTLRNLVSILEPIQAVHLFIAAAQLHLRIHEWGKNKDHGPTRSIAHRLVGLEPKLS